MKKITRLIRLSVGLLALSQLLTLAGGVSAVGYTSVVSTTFTVNSTADPGAGVCDVAECTLREAINAANATGGTDTIAFNIPGSGPHTIQPSSPLPSVTDPVIIDGYTQPGASPNTNPAGSGINALLQIELDGSSAGTANIDGLNITAGSSTVRGLAVNRFSGDGIALFGSGATGNLVEGNFIGTDTTGTIARGNGSGSTFEDLGLRIGSSASQNTVRGNLISGNVDGGLSIDNSAFDNVVRDNLIGTVPSGTAALGNDVKGLIIQSGAQNNLVQDNLISGNNGIGLIVGGSAATSGNRIEGNLIGPDITGNTALGNTSFGVLIFAQAANNTVGGTDPAAANVISGNGGEGLRISGSSTTANVVQGNFIGTNASGMAALGNNAGGITIINGATNNLIGGTVAGARNIISGNGSGGFSAIGVNVQSAGTAGNLIQGNYIGPDATGTGALGNGSFGLVFLVGTANNTVGGTSPGASNIIAHNAATGVLIDDSVSGILLARNSIVSNGGLGIDLGLDGITPNDGNDPDMGANKRQNFPVLNSATGQSNITIEGLLNSAPNTPFTVEFFSNSACDSSGHGEGEMFLGATTVTSNGSGNATISVTFSNPVSGDQQFITATATDPTNNTSEFSSCVQVLQKVFLPIVFR